MESLYNNLIKLLYIEFMFCSGLELYITRPFNNLSEENYQKIIVIKNHHTCL